jgi:hypothetical protein
VARSAKAAKLNSTNLLLLLTIASHEMNLTVDNECFDLLFPTGLVIDRAALEKKGRFS